MAKFYHASHAGRLDTSEATKLVYILERDLDDYGSLVVDGSLWRRARSAWLILPYQMARSRCLVLSRHCGSLVALDKASAAKQQGNPFWRPRSTATSES
jgi:hypothetical protein